MCGTVLFWSRYLEVGGSSRYISLTKHPVVAVVSIGRGGGGDADNGVKPTHNNAQYTQIQSRKKSEKFIGQLFLETLQCPNEICLKLHDESYWRMET